MLKLQLKKWRLTCHYPYVPILGKSVETGGLLRGIFEPIEAEVPGSIYDALYENGIIPNIEEKMNSLSAEWVKDRWWLYETEFSLERVRGRSYELYFGGVDYECEIYLNNRFVGSHVGELLPFSFEIGDYVREGTNTLRVLVRNIPDGMGQIGCTDRHSIQRHRFDYKWDFSCKLLNIGIYRPVWVREHGGFKLESFYFRTVCAAEGRAVLETEVSGKGKYTVEARLFDGERPVFQGNVTGETPAASLAVSVPDAKLWYPVGMGEPHCYRLEIRVFDGSGALSDFREQTVGFREIAFRPNTGAPADALPYTLEVNGKRTFLRGFSVVPFDQRLGRTTEADYERYIRAAAEANANMLRVWGGGIIEQESFYDLCSRYGLLVWQDFIQSSSGINSVPCEEKCFLDPLREQVEHTVKTRRNYPAMCVFCGGNELFGKDGKPVSFENRNIALIRSVVEAYSDVYMLPSTSSGPTQEASLTAPALNHDIHGPWVYLGNAREYCHFNSLKCLFAGEFGANGLASLGQIRRITGEEEPEIRTMNDPLWRHHGDWWDVREYVLDVFGFMPSRIEDYILLSSYIQLNAVFYGIGSFRRDYPYQSGCLVWQLNEPFPNIACTSMIDFYGEKKHVYHAVRDAYAPFVATFKYDRLAHEAGEEFVTEVYLTSDDANGQYDVRLTLEAGGKKLGEWRERTSMNGNPTVLLKKLSCKVPDAGASLLLYAEACGGGHTVRTGVLFPVKGKQEVTADIEAYYRTLGY